MPQAISYRCHSVPPVPSHVSKCWKLAFFAEEGLKDNAVTRHVPADQVGSALTPKIQSPLRVTIYPSKLGSQTLSSA